MCALDFVTDFERRGCAPPPLLDLHADIERRRLGLRHSPPGRYALC